MLRRFVCAVIVVFAASSQSLGFEVGAIIRKIDVDKRVAVVFANGQDRTVKIAGDVKIQDEVGKDLSGLGSMSRAIPPPMAARRWPSNCCTSSRPTPMRGPGL